MPTADAPPTLIIIGAMKCGTTALHRQLGRHPAIAMSAPKELNFFIGPEGGDGPDPGDGGTAPRWVAGNWWRGVAWYRRHFPATAPVRGESSPGYTSPDHPEVANRMAAVAPDVKLVYLVRDPIARALSQYRHHRREGTESRPIGEALRDPRSQYLARSRYHERLLPFLACFARRQLLVVAQEELRDHPLATLRLVSGFAGADPSWWHEAVQPTPRARSAGPTISRALRDELAAALRDDAARLRSVADRRLPRWTV